MQRKKYDAIFKARVALEAVKGLKTINEIAGEYGVHPNMVIKWKRQLVEGLPSIFSLKSPGNGEGKVSEELLASLYQKIGQLEVEREWLKKKSVQLR